MKLNLLQDRSDGAPDSGADSDPQLAALWDALRRDPDDVETYLVLGDWLQARGDVRGQLVAIECALALGDASPALVAARRELFEVHGRALLGPLSQWVASGHLSLVWYCGYIRAAALHRKLRDRMNAAAVVRALARHPSAALLRELRLSVRDPGESYGPVLGELSRAGPRPSLERLEIGEPPAATAFATDVDLGPVWASAPRLRELCVQGREVAVGAPRAPWLEVFAVRTPRLGADAFAAILGAAWPRLSRLELWPGDARSWPRTLEALAGPGFPVLAHLGLCNTDDTNALVDALARSPLLARLRSLDLSGGAMTDRGAYAIVQHRAAFAHLERIRLDHNFVSESAVGELRRRFGTAVVNPKHQRNPRRGIKARLVAPGQ